MNPPMWIRVNRRYLEYAASICQGIANLTRECGEDFWNVQILASGMMATLHAKSSFGSVYVTIPCEVENPGCESLDALYLWKFVCGIRSDQVDIAVDEKCKSAWLVAGDSKLNIPCSAGKEPHAIDKSLYSSLGKITMRRFAAALYEVLPATPKYGQDPRRVLLGCAFRNTPGRTEAIGTNGKVLSLSVLPHLDLPRDIIVPREILSELSKHVPPPWQVGGDRSSIHVGLNDERTLFSYTVDDKIMVSYTAELINGKYPNCDAVIPKTFKRSHAVEKRRLLVMLRRAMKFVDKSTVEPLVWLTFKSDVLFVTVPFSETKGFVQSVPATSDSQESFEAIFNVRLLLTSLASINAREITFQSNGPHEPLVLSHSGSASMCMVMPIRAETSVNEKDDDE
jgi:DNA polymerase III sliding clamp (beta) subunit (PCNA family)